MSRRPIPMSRIANSLIFALVVLMVSICSKDASSGPIDPAARGLDAFVELPRAASAGAKIAIDLRTFGFSTAVDSAPLGAVTVEAAWQGADEQPVSVVTDGDGLATLELSMPEGAGPQATFKLGLVYGGHRRARTFDIERTPRLEVELHIQEQEVAPGSEIPAWVLVRDLETGAPAANVDVMLKLAEGGVPRQTTLLRTDASGAASAVVAIPEVEEPTFGWRLEVSTVSQASLGTHADLTPREDVPAQPTLTAGFDAVRLPAGSNTVVHVRATSATGDGVAGAEVRYLVTDEGPAAEPTFDQWEKTSKVVLTDDAGQATIPYAVPAVGFATKKRITLRALLDGREREVQSVLEVVAKLAPSIEVIPEAGALVPGVDERILVRARDGWDKPIVGAELRVEGDGLDTTVKTDARGLAEVSWKLPKDIGADRKVGPCSGGVAATVRVTAIGSASPELLSAGSVPKCLVVDRSRQGILKPAALVVRAGETVGVETAFTDGHPEQSPMSVSVSGRSGTRSTLAWLKGKKGEARVPASAGGVLVVAASVPRANAKVVSAESAILVKPRVLPKLSARVAGGRLAPGGDVDVEAKLVDEAGAPLMGSVTGLLYDRFSRSDDAIPPDFDTRLRLCKAAAVAPADCDAVLTDDPALMPLLRAALSQAPSSGVRVVGDPGGSAKEEMRQTFNTVLKNLEGAVFESSSSVESLRDVLRKGPKGREFNPEILTLVTAALATPPTTPGGEPFTLADLRALDPQVDYDTVARRVTRLKMFRILSAVRTFRNAQDLAEHEPVLQDPNAILRRLFQSGEDGVDLAALEDPWGGAMQFVKGNGGGLPFIEAIPGWELHAPGPDGRIGTSDDVKDPFARVVKSGSPYARAMGEDKIVDSRLDMRVGDETVAKWSSLLEELTGSSLSTGEGMGSGHGRLGGSHRTKAPSLRMGATSVTRENSTYVLSAPVRTDKDGIAHLRLPLGGDETTYRVLLLALPDGAGPAANTVDVTTSLPLSVRLDAGTKWTNGDVAEVRARVTNRTGSAIEGKLRFGASGAADLVAGEVAERTVSVGPNRSTVVSIRVRARAEGIASFRASVTAGDRSDAVEHRIMVGPNGHRMTLARSRWVASDVLFDAFANDDITKLEGAPTLLLEGSFDPTLSGVMDSLRADRLSSRDATVDAIEVFERLRLDFEKRDPALAARATTLRDQAIGRFTAIGAPGEAVDTGIVRRARFWVGTSTHLLGDALPSDACPTENPGSVEERLRDVESEPAPSGGGVASCWDASITSALRAVKDAHDPVMLARLVLAFAARSHRESLARDLVPELAKLVLLKPTGEVTLGGTLTGDRSAKATVYAALVRATALGIKPGANADMLLGWLIVQRAPDGSFGSPVASRAAVEALEAVGASRAPRRVIVTELDADGAPIGSPRDLRVTTATRIPVDPRTKHIGIRVVPTGGSTDAASSGGLLARLEQTALRSFSFKPGPRDLANPLSVEVKWPGDASTAHTSSLEVRFVDKAEGAPRLVARIPLVPGASLAEPVEGVKAIGGALLVTTTSGDAGGPSLPTLIPLRFSMAGEFTVPEATVRDAGNDSMHGRAMATRLRVLGAHPAQHE